MIIRSSRQIDTTDFVVPDFCVCGHFSGYERNGGHEWDITVGGSGSTSNINQVLQPYCSVWMIWQNEIILINWLYS